MATNELERAARNANNQARALQNALDILERTLSFYDVHSLSAELDGLTAGEEILDGIDKERAETAIDLAASLAFYLRGMDDGSGNTILGDPPLAAPALKQHMEELGI